MRRDEALAAAAEEAAEQRMQEEDAARRTAILRGEAPPPLASAPAAAGGEAGPEIQEDPSVNVGSGREWEKQARKRTRRLKGEDDTDRDIRVAKEDAARGREVRERLGSSRGEREEGEVRVTDERGHIALFEEPRGEDGRGERKTGRQGEKRRKEEEEEGGMRLADAAGYRAEKDGPWYISSSSSTRNGGTGSLEVVGRDAFGREDPGRKERDEKRAVGSDPMAVMRRAQGQLKQAERERQNFEEKRKAELRKLDDDRVWEEEQRRKSRRKRHEQRKSGHGQRSPGEDSLEGFSLDPLAHDKKRKRHHDSHERHEHRHRRDRSRRSRSPHRRREGDRCR